MKWVTHIAWGVAISPFFHVNFDMALFLATLHTVITDVLGHVDMSRAPWHDILSIVVGIVLGVYYGLPIYGVVLGLLHVALDLISPGGLAISWPYNALFLFLALNLYIWGLNVVYA